MPRNMDSERPNTAVVHVVEKSTNLRGSSLREELINLMEPSDFDSEQLYVPVAKLKGLFCEVQIDARLQELGKFGTTKDDLRTFIVQHAPRTFATLVYLRLEAKILDFHKNDLHDSKMPINLDKAQQSAEDIPVLLIFKDWSKCDVKEFSDAQWRFHVPTFYPSSELRVYPTRTIFPFSGDMSTGTTFSRVWKIEISPEHGVGTNQFMALKEIELHIDQIGLGTQAMADCLREVNSLWDIAKKSEQAGYLNTLFSDHAIKLHSAFRRGNRLYMLFPWAKQGSLRDLWRKEPNKASLQWFSQQVVALVGSLSLLYEVGCRHGDLKPDNILVFDEYVPVSKPVKEFVSGSLKLCQFDSKEWRIVKQAGLGDLVIADFDVAKIHEDATRFRDSTHALQADRRYEPPETDRNHPNHDKSGSRSYDVWSLGCIFLEFIIWRYYGKNGLDLFNDELGDRRVEKFWKFDDGYKVHPVVTKWAKRLQDRKLRDDEDKSFSGFEDAISFELDEGLTLVEYFHKEATYLSKFLELIMSGMLVTKTDTDEEEQGPYRLSPFGVYCHIIESGLGGDWHVLMSLPSQPFTGTKRDVDGLVDQVARLSLRLKSFNGYKRQ